MHIATCCEGCILEDHCSSKNRARYCEVTMQSVKVEHKHLGSGKETCSLSGKEVLVRYTSAEAIGSVEASVVAHAVEPS